MTVEEYASIYDNKKYTPTPFQLREKDYMYLYSKEEYWIGEYDDHMCERGIAQFMNYATPGTEKQNNCELVPFMKDSREWLAAKVTAVEVQEGEQLLTRYGGRKVVVTVNCVYISLLCMSVFVGVVHLRRVAEAESGLMARTF